MSWQADDEQAYYGQSDLVVLGLYPDATAATHISARVAVLIPCYNEALTIENVVRDFRRALPQSRIYVYDNNSTDATAGVAKAAGAIVGREPLQGKGNVVRRMFADIDADVYVLVDGDDTYDAASAPRLIEHLLSNSLDLVNAARVPVSEGAFRAGHVIGNVGLSRLVGAIFGRQIGDMLSGYRVMSRRFVKSFPALSRGFETETELVVHALDLRLPVAELETPYRERPTGSESKLHTVRDGTRVLRTIVSLVKDERPLAFFGGIGVLLALAALLIGWPLVSNYIETGLVPRLPTAVLVMGILNLACMSVVAGMVLATVTHGRRELKRLHYLSLSGSSPRQPWQERATPGTNVAQRERREVGRGRAW